MTHSQDPGSSSDDGPPDGVSASDEHAEHWATLAEMLDASNPQEIVAHVRALQQSMTALEDQLDDSDGDELGGAMQEVREHLSRLREQNADLASPSDAEFGAPTGHELHPETEVLLDQLDAASLPEAQERVRSLTEQVDHLYQEKETLAEAGLMSGQEALAEINRLQKECDRLRSQQTEGADASSRREEITDILGITSVEEARELDEAVRRLSNRLEGLVDEREELADTLGVADADAILDLVQSMEAQLVDFYESQDRRGGSGAPAEVEEILGVSDAEEARELVSYVHAMNDRLEQLAAEHKALAEENLDARKAVEMINNMEDQLVDLYGTADTATNGRHANGSASSSSPEEDAPDSAVLDILGVSGPDEARELDQLVRRMGEELDRLRSKTETLADHDLTAEMALNMLHSMEEQLIALYDGQERRAEIAEALTEVEQVLGVEGANGRTDAETLSDLVDQIQNLLEEGRAVLPNGEDIPTVRALLREMSSRLEVIRTERDVHADRAGRLKAMEEVLGISSLEEARELTSLVQNLDAQLQALYAEREKLNEVGLSSVEDAVDMIQSMDGQLQELYQEQEALTGQTIPEHVAEQDTFEQLEWLYKEQEKLQRALGVSDADEVIEMVEDLTAQLDDLYADQDPAAASASGSGSTSEESSRAADASPETRMTLASMQQQLETLYTEREALLRRGIETAEDAAARIDDLQDRLDTLREEHEACQEQMEKLESTFGTTDVSEIAETLGQGQNLDWDVGASSPLPDPPFPEAANDDPFVDATPALLPEDALSQLDQMSSEELDALPVGALRLDDEGRIQTLNEKGLSFPGLGTPTNRADVTGTRLFERVPGTSNTLFLGRFRNGVEQGEMDARFPYTFVTPGDRPTVFLVHLYRKGGQQANWLLFRPA
jgi:photoactive yellow protein